MLMNYRLPLVLAVLALIIGARNLKADDASDPLSAPAEGVITFADGSSAQFKTTGKAPVMIRDERTGDSYSFFSLRDHSSSCVRIEVIESRKSGKTSRAPLELADSPKLPGATRVAPRDASFFIDFLPSKLPGNSPGQDDQFGGFLKSGEVCCVTCGPRTICAESVILSCGSCFGGEWENSY